jgi:hypothetical protein
MTAKFEYRIEDGKFESHPSPATFIFDVDAITRWLNRFGEDGWDVFKIIYGTSFHVQVTMKRKIDYRDAG